MTVEPHIIAQGIWAWCHIDKIKDLWDLVTKVLAAPISLVLSLIAIFNTRRLKRNEAYNEDFGIRFRECHDKALNYLENIDVLKRSSDLAVFDDEVLKLKDKLFIQTTPILRHCSRLDSHFRLKTGEIGDEFITAALAAREKLATLKTDASSRIDLDTYLRTAERHLEKLNHINSVLRTKYVKTPRLLHRAWRKIRPLNIKV